MQNDHVLWVERYRPHKISDCILPESMKATFQQYVTKGDVPNMILAGGPGMGKTTVARAMCDELGLDHILINGSNESNIDTLRTKIVGYASAVSLTGGRKVIIIDEADYLNPNSTQPAFRGVIEEYAGNCSFVFTCNYKSRIIEPLHSRCAVVDFKIDATEKPKLAGQFFKRIQQILIDEKVEYDKATVVELVKKYFPDFRRVLNELQRYSISGKIDAGIFASQNAAKVDEAIKYLVDKDFGSLRKWVGSNIDTDTDELMRSVYDRLYDTVDPKFIPVAVVLIGRYMYQAAFCADKQINLMAMFSEMMLELEFKKS
jgi:DNA polymerase III delta prime subunit